MMITRIQFTALLLGFLTSLVPAQQQSEKERFEEFKRREKQGAEEQDYAYLKFKAEYTARYKKYVEEQEKKFKEYVGNIESKWGKDRTRTSTRKDYVGYDKDFTKRRSVDFEKGQATVEVLVDPKDAADAAMVKKKIEDEIVKMLRDKGTDDPLAAQEKAPPLPEPILTNQVQTKDGNRVKPETAQQFAVDVALGSSVKREEVVGKDGTKRISVSAGFPLIPNHVKQRAEEFRNDVLKQSKRFSLDPRLVFAVMHTESYFNPKARSSAPAYGLMQLVPSSGARSAYLHVYKEDKLVTADYLYTPPNNVELGAGLLNLMLTKDFKNITDEKSRVYCAIAGYNTGPGNVARSFAGKRDIPKAVAQINQMSSDQVFEHLSKNLPFVETRTYIKTVTDRFSTYEEWSGSK